MIYRYWLQLCLALLIPSCNVFDQTLTGLISTLDQPSITSIAEIRRNWKDYTTVSLKGKVGKHIPFLESSAYEIEDSTGRIWVLTTKPIPKPQREVWVEGKPQFMSIPIAGQELGEIYIQELKRKEVIGQSTIIAPSVRVHSRSKQLKTNQDGQLAPVGEESHAKYLPGY